MFLVGEVATLPVARAGALDPARDEYGFVRIASPLDSQQFRERAFEPLRETFAKWVLKVNPRTSLEAISLRLLGAGLGRRISPTGFLAAKGFLAVGGALIGLLVMSVTGSGRASCSSGALGRGGFIAPGLLRLAEGEGAPRDRSAPISRTRSTCSRSASRPASASTARSRS